MTESTKRQQRAGATPVRATPDDDGRSGYPSAGSPPDGGTEEPRAPSLPAWLSESPKRADGGGDALAASTGEGGDPPTVLVADDERLMADAYAQWLEDAYPTRVAYGGDEAVELFDETVDVAVLDRRMPDRSGDDVAAMIREQAADCGVGMVSASEPGLDVVDVAYDQYLVKPVTDPDALRGLVETLHRRVSYGPKTRRLLALASKKEDIEARVSTGELERSSEYADMIDELETLQSEVAGACETLADEGFRTPF